MVVGVSERPLDMLQTCSKQLIAIKDEIHGHWSNSQKFYSQWLEPKEIRYPVPRIETNLILQAARRALDIATECGVKKDIVDRIQRIRDGLFSKLGESDEERVGIKGAYVFASKEEADSFLFDEVGFNGLANAVHDAAYDMLLRQPAKRYAGCNVHGRDIDIYGMKFCEGSKEAKTFYLGNGRLEASMGLHKAVITFKDIGPRLRRVTIDYTESDYNCSPERLGGVRKNLKRGLGFDCEEDTLLMKCEGKIEDPDDAKLLGSFIFGVKDMDIWRHCECVWEGVDTAFERAEEASEVEGWTLLNKIFEEDTECLREIRRKREEEAPF